jgi:hypothetical protein
MNLPGTKLYVQTEAVLTREPVSEALAQTIGGSVNFLLSRNYVEREWSVNGGYAYFTGQTALDTVWTVPTGFNATIADVVVGHKLVGTGGTTTINIERSTDNGSTWSTIFSTAPSIASNAANYAWCGIGQTVTGFTAPVLIGSPAAFNVSAGDGFRMSITSAMTGSATDLWARIILLSR